jgi:heme/copper-type cytochrome/quinol oxidase subunit 1
VDYWALALLVLGIGSVSTSINFIVTVLTQRAPHMTLRRLPLFSWMIFVNSFLVILALPVLNAALVMLLIDRRLDTHFFPAAGRFGNHVAAHFLGLWPSGSLYRRDSRVRDIVGSDPGFSRKPIFGYEFVAGSTVAIAFLSLLVWAHHMFTVGLGTRWTCSLSHRAC